MKSSIRCIVAIAMFCMVLNFAAFAQLSLGVQTGPGKSSNSGGIVGHAFGINLRYFTTPKFAVGISGRLQTDEPDYYFGERKTKVTGGIMPIALTADYFLSKGVLRPYIGADAGVYFSAYRAKLDDNIVLNATKKSSLGAAPRAGLVLALGNVVGLQIEGVYHFVAAPVNNPINGSNRYGSINLGLIFGLGRK